MYIIIIMKAQDVHLDFHTCSSGTLAHCQYEQQANNVGALAEKGLDSAEVADIAW